MSKLIKSPAFLILSFLLLISFQNCTQGSFEVQSVILNNITQDSTINNAAVSEGEETQIPAPPISNPLATTGLLKISDVSYAGAFRIPLGQHSDGDIYGKYAPDSIATIGGSQGNIALGANNDSLFISSHSDQQAIAEITIPELVNTTKLTDLRIGTVKQDFSAVLDRPLGGNSQGMDRIGGMAYINGKLVVNTYVYYDNNNSSNTTLVLNTANNLRASVVSGYHSFAGKAHASGWISTIPPEWQTPLGGTHITGFSSGIPIINRLSVGPSAFVFNGNAPQLTGSASYSIPSSTLLDYSLDNVIGLEAGFDVRDYLYNTYPNRSNKLWTHLSKAVHGFIVPGTNTYLVIGRSAGHNGGVGYGVPPNGGYKGYYTLQDDDKSPYYWLFDMTDLIKVQKGQIPSYGVMPYAYGPIDIPAFAANGEVEMGGGSYDANKKLLYLSVLIAYNRAPVIIALKVNTPH